MDTEENQHWDIHHRNVEIIIDTEENQHLDNDNKNHKEMTIEIYGAHQQKTCYR